MEDPGPQWTAALGIIPIIGTKLKLSFMNDNLLVANYILVIKICVTLGKYYFLTYEVCSKSKVTFQISRATFVRSSIFFMSCWYNRPEHLYTVSSV